MSATVTRRSLMAAAVALPMVACVPAAIASPTPFRIAEARYRAATSRYNGLPASLESEHPDEHDREELAFIAASDALDAAPVADWNEFTDALHLATNDGECMPTEEALVKLLADARRLRGAIVLPR